MKKLILILCMCFALTFCFVACDLAEELSAPSNITENTTTEKSELEVPTTAEAMAQGQQTEETTAENSVTEDATTEGITTENVTTEEVTTEEKTYKELTTEDEHGKKLYWTLVDFLGMKLGYDEPLDSILEAQLNRNLQRGRQVTHVQFDTSNYYFVCAYYRGEHANEDDDYCCRNQYTWVIFEDENHIQEYYKDLEFVVAFQINKTLSAIDIATNEDVTTEIEHYMQYTPEFVNGVNIADKSDEDITYICFVKPNDKYMFDCSKEYHHFTYTLSCIELDGEWYIWVNNKDLAVEFGKYYDDLIGVTREYDENHVVIKFDDFAKAVLVS